MRTLIIRDDDLSFFTTVDEIEEIYAPFFKKGVKVSFATIPFSVKMYHAGDFNNFYQELKENPIDKNSSLIEYIKDKIKLDHVEIMLHGYNHLYAFKTKKGKIYPATKKNLEPFRKSGKKITFLGEYNYQDFTTLFKKTKDAKEYLEDIFCTKIKNFVPPSNQIDKNGIKAISKNSLNLSGMINRSYNREINLIGLYSYLKRVVFKLKNKNLTYPYIMDYKDHKELCAYALTPSTNLKRYYDQLKFCKEKEIAFSLATHYWELKGDLRDRFYEIIEYALENKFESRFLKEVLK